MNNKRINLFIMLLSIGCTSIQDVYSKLPIPKNDSNEVSDSTSVIFVNQEIISDEEIIPKSILEEANHFYPIKETLHGIQTELDDLRARVIEYESKISTPRLNTDILKLIKIPELRHEITLENGTIVKGSIFQENADRLIINTQIGQLTIDKGSITSIEEIAKPEPNVEFDGDAIEEIYGNRRIYKGSVKNTGIKRADFTRVVYMLWGENTSLIAKDSSFVDGQINQYESGIITDSGVNPGEYAKFEVIVPIPKESSVEYVTREIFWDVTD